MFGLSFLEIGIILLVAFLIFGPEEFPQKMKQLYALITKIKEYIHQAQTGFHQMRHEIEDQVKPIGQEFEKSLSAASEDTQFNAHEEIVERLHFIDDDENDQFEDVSMNNELFRLFPDEGAGAFESEPCSLDTFNKSQGNV